MHININRQLDMFYTIAVVVWTKTNLSVGMILSLPYSFRPLTKEKRRYIKIKKTRRTMVSPDNLIDCALCR